MPNGKALSRGFTLVELLVVLAIVALLLTIATPRYFNNLQRAKESTLHEDLATMRDSLDKFYGDNGHFPADLKQLVEKKYIKKIPVDPITERSDTWKFTEAEAPEEGIEDVRSGASGAASDGSRYSDW